MYTLSIYNFVNYASRKEDCREIKSVNPKEDQLWIFIRRNDIRAEVSILWSLDVNCWFIEKDPDARKDWGQKEERASEDEMFGWHHWCNGDELGQTLGDGEAQGGLACCSPQGGRESDMTGLLNNNKFVPTHPCLWVAMVQTSKEITRWHYGCNFRLVLALLRTWVFWVVSDLDATRRSQNNVCQQLVTAILLFIKPHNWLLDCTSRVSFRPILLKRNEIYFVYLDSSCHFQLFLLGSVGQKWQTKGLRF